MPESTLTRIYNKIENIDEYNINKFWEQKAINTSSYNAVLLNANLSQDANSIRNKNERDFLFSYLKNKKYNILEIGCGNGRWAENLKDKYIDNYIGIDFSGNFIQQCNLKFKNHPKIKFYQMSATNLDFNLLNSQYDLIIMTGICMYINDEDLKSLYMHLNELLTSNGSLYMQESVSVINKRLTLKDFYSDELKCNYSAIYRVPDEYENFINQNFNNLKLIKSKYLLTKKTGAREETNAFCFYYERGKK